MDITDIIDGFQVLAKNWNAPDILQMYVLEITGLHYQQRIMNNVILFC